MLTFTCAGDPPGILEAGFDALIVAGWTGRDVNALQHHVDELAALGVPRPSTVPVFYRISVNGLTQTRRLEVLGPNTSGEVEPVLLGLKGATYITIGSDHTDRQAETMGVALSKQLCGKVVGRDVWPLSEVVDHWDRLAIRSYATIDGKRTLYQEGTLAAMRNPADLFSLYDGNSTLKEGATMFCGTVPTKSGIRPASHFEMELEDPVRDRKIAHAYDIVALPVVY
jgi:Protein of unknown function (DUF2848)